MTSDPSPEKRSAIVGLLHKVRRRAIHAHVPLAATLELTEHCNLRCRHCYVVDGLTPEDLALSQWRDILDQLASAGTLMLTFTGGEPLSRPDFLDIAAHARSREFSFVLFTNGTLVTTETAERLKDLHPQRVEISLLGGTPSTHDAITRVPGSFDRAVRGAKLLIKLGIAVQFKTIWMQPNIAEAEQMASLASNVGASFRTGFLLLEHRHRKGPCPSLAPTDHQLRGMAQKALQGRGSSSPVRQLTIAQQQRLSPCGAGHASCCIDARGNLTPCVALRMVAGNLLTTPVKEIWTHSRELARLRKIRVSDLYTCRSCALYLNCPRCAAVALAESGDILGAPPQACRLAKTFQHTHEHTLCPLK